jgi:4-amino-4-deoxy-L-arabinose transferase-like glycosyltransferase
VIQQVAPVRQVRTGHFDGPGLAIPPVAPALRRRVLLLTLALGLLLFVWRLGSSGLVDETPPLFAASARAMADTGDWLIPRVNGLPRYDKPPLVYWAMGLLYLLPGQQQWNPLGSWASALPSALASIAVMLALAHTLLRWPQAQLRPALTALTAALAFALSPPVLLWSRVAVSDALFSALVALTLLWAWGAIAQPSLAVWPLWLLLGLAVLAKGPVAVVLLGLTLLLYGWSQGDPGGLWRRLQPLRGLALTSLVALPWYGAALLVEGEPFWRSFFGYHNLQRFTSVVNHHQQPWWFFLLMLVLAGLPSSPLLLLGLGRAWAWRPAAAPLSLRRFAACWLVAVLLFFSVAATKLPSYWLPAIPAAALLVALTAQDPPSAAGRWAWGLTLSLTAVLALGFLASPRWLPLIRDAEMPTLAAELQAGHWLLLAAALFALALLAALLARGQGPGRLLALQLPIVVFVPLVLLPSWALGDRLRGLPVRQMAALVNRQARPGEPLAMVGILKPSLHYYSRRVVIYEAPTPGGSVNLADRLSHERRRGLLPSAASLQPTVLVVIDRETAAQPNWSGLAPQELGRSSIYRLWRVDRQALERRAAELLRRGERISWRDPRPERY